MGFRPQYETDEDRDREIEVARLIESRTGLRVQQLPRRYPADLMVFKEDGVSPRSLIEVKSRRIAFGTYQHFHLSVEKVIGLIHLHEVTGVPTSICANLQDGMFFRSIDSDFACAVEMGGRYDRGDSEDVEPCFCIPWQTFRRMQ